MTTNNNQFLEDQLLDACQNGNLDQVKDLVSQGADIHAWDDSPLRLAAEYGRLPIVQYLIAKGANWKALRKPVLSKLIHNTLANPINQQAYEWALTQINKKG